MYASPCLAPDAPATRGNSGGDDAPAPDAPVLGAARATLPAVPGRAARSLYLLLMQFSVLSAQSYGSVHFWAFVPLQSQICTCVLHVVVALGTSRQRPDCGL